MKPCSREDERGQAAAGPAPDLHARMEHETSDGTELVFEDVYEGYFEFVWRSLRLLGVERASLDDAVQDTFGVIVRQLPHFEGRSSLRTWVYGIAQRVAANHRRAHRRKSAALEPLEQHALPSREPDAHARAEAREAADLILRFCAALEPDRHTLFVLGVLENVPAAELGALLGIPVNTVYTRTHALRLALREELERASGGKR